MGDYFDDMRLELQRLAAEARERDRQATAALHGYDSWESFCERDDFRESRLGSAVKGAGLLVAAGVLSKTRAAKMLSKRLGKLTGGAAKKLNRGHAFLRKRFGVRFAERSGFKRVLRGAAIGAGLGAAGSVGTRLLAKRLGAKVGAFRSAKNLANVADSAVAGSAIGGGISGIKHLLRRRRKS